jgi:uncharacterized repeat protein (TIGR03943 family)
MQNVKTAISRITTCLPAIIFVVWLNIYYWLLRGGRYKAFIQPKLWPLLILALLLLLAFTAAVISRFSLKHPTANQFDAWIKAAILMLPVFFLLTIYGRSLGTDAFAKRMLSPGRMAIKGNLGLRSSSQTTTDYTMSLLDLLADGEKFDGKRVAVEGMVYRTAKNDDHTFMLFRFAVVCCAADALPLSIEVKTATEENLQNDAWVRVDGLFSTDTLRGKQMPSITADSVRQLPIPPPEKRYLFF